MASNEQLFECLAGKSPAVREADRRRSFRQPVGTVGSLVCEGGDAGPALQVLVLNVSVHGVGIRSPVSYRKGSVYSLQIGAGPLHLASRIRIVSSRDRADGSFDIGAQFI